MVIQLAEISASEVVRRALDDADSLMRTSGPLSAVDRVHTAMHGYSTTCATKPEFRLTAVRP